MIYVDCALKTEQMTYKQYTIYNIASICLSVRPFASMLNHSHVESSQLRIRTKI